MSDPTQRATLIAVIGDASLRPDDPKSAHAERMGELIVEAGWKLLTGGLKGVMEAASRGARAARSYRPGDTIGILPGNDPADANPFVDIVIPTGLDHARNTIIAQADAVVAIGGGAGTMGELAYAWIMKRLVIAFRVPGWSGRVADSRLDERIRYATISDDRVFGVNTAEEAIALLQERIGLYQTRHRGIRRR